jgi:DivIVA domain-containing protein
MPGVELDRQEIERRDFPIVRRGYDPASVDAHLRALAAQVEELARKAGSGTRDSLAATAGTQVQGILEAAQATAETIEHEAAKSAQQVRTAADEDARRTRDEAVARAQQHVAAVSKATEALLARVRSLDSETDTLVESLRSGATRLAGELTAVHSDMEALYDAAAKGSGADGTAEPGSAQNGDAYAPVPARAPESRTELPAEPQPAEAWPEPEAVLEEKLHEAQPSTASGDLDGARLVALNMALNGDAREVTSRYIAENFEVPEPERLLDEVYAAIEG